MLITQESIGILLGLLALTGLASAASVSNYGAKCDGKTDDSAAFQKAFNAVTPGDPVVDVPAGTCVVVNISIKGGGATTVLRGVPSGTTLRRSSSDASTNYDHYLLKTGNGAKVVIYDIWFDGYGISQSTSNAFYVYIGVSTFDIERCTFVGGADGRWVNGKYQQPMGGIATYQGGGVLDHLSTRQEWPILGVQIRINTGGTLQKTTLSNSRLMYGAMAGVYVTNTTASQPNGNVEVFGNTISNISAQPGDSGQSGNGIQIYSINAINVHDNLIYNVAFSLIRMAKSASANIHDNQGGNCGETCIYSELAAYQNLFVANTVVNGQTCISSVNIGQRIRDVPDLIDANVCRNMEERCFYSEHTTTQNNSCNQAAYGDIIGPSNTAYGNLVVNNTFSNNAGGISGAALMAPNYGGAGYTSAPTVNFTGGGCDLLPTATAAVSNGTVQSINLTTAGQNCKFAPTITLSGGSPSKPATPYVLYNPMLVGVMAEDDLKSDSGNLAQANRCEGCVISESLAMDQGKNSWILNIIKGKQTTLQVSRGAPAVGSTGVINAVHGMYQLNGQMAKVLSVGDRVTATRIWTGGSGYPQNPPLTVSGNCTTLPKLSATVGTEGGNAGAILSVKINNPGAGCKGIPTVSIGGGGSDGKIYLGVDVVIDLDSSSYNDYQQVATAHPAPRFNVVYPSGTTGYAFSQGVRLFDQDIPFAFSKGMGDGSSIWIPDGTRMSDGSCAGGGSGVFAQKVGGKLVCQ